MLVSAAYSVSGLSSFFSCSKIPKLGYKTALNFSHFSKIVRMGENA